VQPRKFAVLLTFPAVVAFAQLSDYKGYKDLALFTRMPHYFLSDEGSFVDSPFDGVDFTVKSGTQRVEGHHTKYSYNFDPSAGPNPSFLQIIRNYQAAARRIGGEVLSDDGARRTTLRVSKNGTETWVAVEAFNEGRNYELDIIEKQAMVQDVVANAAAFQAGLKENGHVEVPGIFFDFGKSEIKPESDAALAEVVKLLRSNPAMKVWVVGHTDNVGSVDSNLTLSGARAAAVVKALATKGIAAGRMAPHGAGPYAPVASNATEQGRAHNRRVELVAQP
jgi:outer membrane protein OmpA-like peptidoglycan-associated protein